MDMRLSSRLIETPAADSRLLRRRDALERRLQYGADRPARQLIITAMRTCRVQIGHGKNDYCDMPSAATVKGVAVCARHKQMATTDDHSEKRDFGLLPDEEAHLARECLRQGGWPREVRIERTGTIYRIYNKRQAKRLLLTLGIEHEQ